MATTTLSYEHHRTPEIRRRSCWYLFLLPLIGVLLGGTLASEWIAYNLSYHPALSARLPWGRFAPWSFVTWRFSIDAPQSLFFEALLIFGCTTFLSIGTLKLFLYHLRKETPNHDLHGSARFATFEEIKETGLLSPNATGSGIYLGKVFDRRGKAYYLRHNGPEHAIVFAPTRAGKGISIVIPTALTWAKSLVCLDIKGELFELTSEQRKEALDNTIYKIDLTDTTGTTTRYNPLAEVRLGTIQEQSDVENILCMLIDRDTEGSQKFWNSGGFNWLVGVTLFTLYEEHKAGNLATMTQVAWNLSSPIRPLDKLITEMRENTFGENNTPHKRIALAAQSMANVRSDETRTGLHSTAETAMGIFLESMIAQSMSASDFRVRDLMNNKTPATLYIVIRPSDLNRLMPIARIIINQIIQLNTESMSAKEKHYRHELLLLLDEFPALGRVPVFEKALGYIAGYGLRTLIIAQDRSQIVTHYGKNETIIPNCHLRICFAPNELETAKWISEMTGVSTIIKESANISGKRAAALLEQVSTSLQEVRRPLMTPDEVMRLPGAKKDAEGRVVEGGEVLVFVAGRRVIRGRQMLYFRDMG